MDRCIFLLFCEDMGKMLDFPVNLVSKVLSAASKDEFFSSTGNDIWEKIKLLFDAMRDGGMFPPSHKINRFNGGLFEANGKLESLTIPNRVFCSEGQGGSPEAIAEIKNSLLYFSATYNFGASGSGKSTISLYALGRIFEQSITELEYMEAEAEAAEQAETDGKDIDKAIKNAKSIAKLNKRKRNGVYYTPEWVTAYIVRETIGARLQDECNSLDLEIGRSFTEKQIGDYRKNIGKKAGETNVVRVHLNGLDQYQDFLSKIKVLDPACGSGAFLIQALEFLLSQHEIVIAERERLAGAKSVFDQDTIIRDILTNNLYGVDLSPESVEIAQLALWLNTARKDKPLSNLDHHIREGNSLVGPDYETFYKNQHDRLFGDLDEDEKEKVNPFDWKMAFPEVFGDDLEFESRGFDCVVGNPPYVKLQNFRKIKPDESQYLLHHKSASAVPVYASTQTGNSDLYLPFIEKGISLLHRRGRMGYIAPNVWLKNEYGEGLRKKLKTTGQMDRWIDFKSFQVFDEATVYTSLQFFAKHLQRHLNFNLSPNGNVVDIDWSNPRGKAPISKLSETQPWILLYQEEWRLFSRLKKECKRLDDVAVTKQIFQGLITSADWCYHLDRTEDGRFIQTKKHSDKSPPDGVEYSLETEIMKPLVSGAEAKRYLTPRTTTFLIFPYDISGDSPRLWSPEEMEEKFPETWLYLKRYEKLLRARESSAFDDDQWYRFGRSQSLDKQGISKLIVPRLVENLISASDEPGEFYPDNVDVGGVIPSDSANLDFLNGILNSPVADFCFQQISKPFRGGFLSANKQFIAPIPIPDATDQQRNDVSQLAKSLQLKHSARRNEVVKLQTRIASPNCLEEAYDEEWLWAEIETVASFKEKAPDEITAARERTKWAKKARNKKLEEQYEKLDSLLRAGMELCASHEDDAISVKGRVSRNSEVTLITKFGLDPREAELIAALWTQRLRDKNVTEKFSGKALVNKLLKFRAPKDDGLRKTILDIHLKICELDREIDEAEAKINAITYKLYGLTPAEIVLVETTTGAN